MALRAAKQLLRKDVKLRIRELSEEEKLRQSKVVTDKVRINVLIMVKFGSIAVSWSRPYPGIPIHGSRCLLLLDY